MYSHSNEWAYLHLLGQPNSFLARRTSSVWRRSSPGGRRATPTRRRFRPFATAGGSRRQRSIWSRGICTSSRLVGEHGDHSTASVCGRCVLLRESPAVSDSVHQVPGFAKGARIVLARPRDSWGPRHVSGPHESFSTIVRILYQTISRASCNILGARIAGAGAGVLYRLL
jgi:hypothetical protein